MKRFWLVLLSLGLVMAFSASVFAADVKFTGSFYAAGMYMDNTGLIDGDEKPSTAFYYQRLRVQMDFIATPYLKLITRFDAMERMWGNTRVAGGVDPQSYGTREENENIAFDWAYIWYASKIGIWSVGIMEDGAWGTVFSNNAMPEGKVAWMLVKMPFIVGLQIVKLSEFSSSTATPAPWGTQSDVDADKYQGYFIYNFKAGKVAGQAGLLGYYVRNAAFRPNLAPAIPFPNSMYKQDVYGLIPYAKAKIGPVAVEAEVQYQWGKARDWESGIPVALDDVKISSWSAYVDALADLGMFYVGGTFAWIQGNDPGTAKAEGTLSGGIDWNPCLLMFNYDRTYWAGALPGAGVANNNPMTNAWFGQIRGGVRPIADLDIMMSVAYAMSDEDVDANGLAVAGIDDEYGWEVDVTATYKITNNLSYMLGVGYWMVGDYYEGGVVGADTKDNFIVLNKLTLTF
ncbi:MAG: hypothetical protein JW914_03765 [Syntrophaceae bacterium]|nr:hypothetical protein [Syntrophaceae bacterium]